MDQIQRRSMLKLYTRHAVNDLETYRVVAEILKNENRFVSRQAYSFLKASSVAYQEITLLLDDYEQRE